MDIVSYIDQGTRTLENIAVMIYMNWGEGKAWMDWRKMYVKWLKTMELKESLEVLREEWCGQERGIGITTEECIQAY